jgi:hypothetical protein
MDCGFNFQERQGLKRKEKDLIVNTFKLQVDCGFIFLKGRDSLAKRTAEAVRFILSRWITIWWFGLDPAREGVRADLTRWILILRFGLYLPSDLIPPAGSEMGGPDLKYRANRYARTPSVGSRSRGADPSQLRSNPTRRLRIGWLGFAGARPAAGWSPELASAAALRRRRPISAVRA